MVRVALLLLRCGVAALPAVADNFDDGTVGRFFLIAVNLSVVDDTLPDPGIRFGRALRLEDFSDIPLDEPEATASEADGADTVASSSMTNRILLGACTEGDMSVFIERCIAGEAGNLDWLSIATYSTAPYFSCCPSKLSEQAAIPYNLAIAIPAKFIEVCLYGDTLLE